MFDNPSASQSSFLGPAAAKNSFVSNWHSVSKFCHSSSKNLFVSQQQHEMRRPSLQEQNATSIQYTFAPACTGCAALHSAACGCDSWQHLLLWCRPGLAAAGLA